jgi:predicted DNA binding CopG/RHH family protein
VIVLECRQEKGGPSLMRIGRYEIPVYILNMPKARKTRRKVPKSKTEDQERKFWSEHDSADYIHWSKAKHVKLANLRPTTRTISIRLPETMIESLKVLANKRDVPYQSLLKLFVAENWKKNRELCEGGL